MGHNVSEVLGAVPGLVSTQWVVAIDLGLNTKVGVRKVFALGENHRGSPEFENGSKKAVCD
jgi:hypothetical protein